MYHHVYQSQHSLKYVMPALQIGRLSIRSDNLIPVGLYYWCVLIVFLLVKVWSNRMVFKSGVWLICHPWRIALSLPPPSATLSQTPTLFCIIFQQYSFVSRSMSDSFEELNASSRMLGHSFLCTAGNFYCRQSVISKHGSCQIFIMMDYCFSGANMVDEKRQASTISSQTGHMARWWAIGRGQIVA